MGNCFLSKPKQEGSNTEEFKNQKQPQLKNNTNKTSKQNNDTEDNQKKEEVKQQDIQIKIEEPAQNRKSIDDQKLEKSPKNLQVDGNQDQQSMASDMYSEDEYGKKVRKDKNKKVKKMKADYREEGQIFENIVKLERQKTAQDIQFIVKALGNHFVFNQLSTQDKEQVCSRMYYCQNNKDNIFSEGDEASSYFIIEKGECQVIINNSVRRILKAGDAFGELALLYGAKRSATIKCIDTCSFWAIDRVLFRKSVEEIVSREYEENRQFIEKTKFFAVMTEQQKDNITHVTISTMYKKKGHQVVCQGDIATSYFIIKKGTIQIQKNGKIIAQMGAGDEFGENALTEDAQRGATVLTGEDNVILLSIGRDQIQKVLGNKVKLIMFNNLMKWAFEKNKILAQLTKIQVEKMLNRAQIVEYQENTNILEAGKTCQKLIFVLEGKLKRKKSGRVVAEKGYAYGEEFLQANKQQEQMTDSYVMEKNSVYSVITFKQFFEVIGGSLEQVLKKNVDSHEKYLKKYDGKQAEKYIKWKLEDLTSIKKLGFGQFGSVYLCKQKLTKNEYYALKVIQKAQVIEQCLEKHLLQEKKVLENVHFPFIMQFIRTFKDNNNVYFLVEYIKGMELFDVIREIGLLNTYDSQFYVGSMLLCIEYLHMQSIIYRDIKPENIMVDHRGFLKLIDMGTAKFLKGKGGRTFTIIGTPHYMAPEIISGKGYTYSVDLWSVGICLYEFMCGGVPFAEEADDPYEIYEEIMRKGSLTFPSWLKDKLAKQLMQQLLNKIPEMRLGSSYAALKANQWFDTFDWDKLMKYQLKPPYIPPKDKIITQNEIKKMEDRGMPVIQEVKKEQGSSKYNKQKAKDPNWDIDF